MLVTGSSLLDSVLVPAHTAAYGYMKRSVTLATAENTPADLVVGLLEMNARAAALHAAALEALGQVAESPADLEAATVEALEAIGTGPAHAALLALALALAECQTSLGQVSGLINQQRRTEAQHLLAHTALSLLEAAENALNACSGGTLRITLERGVLRLRRAPRRRR